MSTLQEHPPADRAEDPVEEPLEVSGGAAEESELDRQYRRERLFMLVVPPIVVALVLGGWVWWRQTATLDTAEANALAWSQVRKLTWQHVELTAVASILVVLLAIPLGIMLTRGNLKRFAPIVVGIANAGQAAPSIGLIALFFLWLGGGFWTAIIALTLYGLLPVLRNTITGLQGVDPTLVEAARGMGMSSFGTLMRVELPLAMPVIMSGVRTALVLVCGTASLAFLIAGGGLGVMLNTGITLFRFSVMVSAALLIAVLALTIEWVGRLLEIALRPRGI